MRMKIALFLLGAFVCAGVSADYYDSKEYGETKFFWLPRGTHSIEFVPKDTSNVTVLWKEGDSRMSKDRKRLMSVLDLQLYHLTPKDSGRYIMRDKYQEELAAHVLEVKVRTKSYEKKPGDSLRIFSTLDPTSCNIYFFPESKRLPRESKIEVIREGRPKYGLDDIGCIGFGLLRPCGISNDFLRMSCNGHFEIRDQNDNTALKVILEMKRKEQHYERDPGERLSISVNLEQHSCNIYFVPEIDHEPGKTIAIVREGRMQRAMEGCLGFEQSAPCGITNEHLQVSCNGHFEVRDQNGDEVLKVTLEMGEPPDEISAVGIGAGIFFFFAGPLCCCLKYCCCGESSSSKEDESETAAEPAAGPAAGPAARSPAGPAAHSQEHNNEPVAPSQNLLSQPSWTSYPSAPSYSVTDPLIHCHPPVDMPPPYSELSAPVEQTDAPTVPVQSDPEPRFELNMTFPSAPSYNDVYTSDKMNFP